MIKSILTILFFLQVFNLIGQENEPKIGNILLDCLTRSYETKGVDIGNELLELENYLIETNILKSASGQAYFDFYQQVVFLNDVPGTLDYEKFSAIYTLKPNAYYSNACLQQLTKLDSSTVTSSKYLQLSLKLQKIAISEAISPSKVASQILSILTPSDFDKAYFRAIGLLTIAHTSNPDVEYPSSVIQSQIADYSDFQKVTIKTLKKKQILLNGIVVEKEELQKELRAFITENQSTHVIECTSDTETPYGFYQKVQHYILEVYSMLRDEKAQEIYGKLYSQLEKNEKIEIINIYPQRISE